MWPAVSDGTSFGARHSGEASSLVRTIIERLMGSERSNFISLATARLAVVADQTPRWHRHLTLSAYGFDATASFRIDVRCHYWRPPKAGTLDPKILGCAGGGRSQRCCSRPGVAHPR